MPEVVSSLALGALKGLVIFGVLSGLAWLVSRARPRHSMLAEGRIAPSRGLIAVVVLIGAGLAVAAAFDATQGGGTAAVLVSAGAVLLTLLMATGLTPAYDVSWTGRTITGPTSNGVWPFGPSRATLAFDDVADVGCDSMGNWYVADAEGTRIRWNWSYAGYPAVMIAVEQACPHLFAEDAAGPGGPHHFQS
ncbi:MAG: hypothetical protein ACT4OK_03890 [Gemmobacter sp.]